MPIFLKIVHHLGEKFIGFVHLVIVLLPSKNHKNPILGLGEIMKSFLAHNIEF
jgi:hypothetical protein